MEQFVRIRLGMGDKTFVGNVFLPENFGMHVCFHGLSVANIFSLSVKKTSDFIVVPSAKRIK